MQHSGSVTASSRKNQRDNNRSIKMQTLEHITELLVLGDANAETNSPTGTQEQELNPDEKYDE